MTEHATNALTAPEKSKSNGLILRWLLFFAICLGLGYAALARYDPKQIPGLSDSIIYLRLVTGDQALGRDLRFRILVPYVAKPFYWLAKGQLGPEKSALFGLLIANSLFCATSASLLVSTSAVGLATVTISRSVISGQTAWPWHTDLLNPEMGYLARLRDSIFSRSFWYVFYWLLPLGVWRLRHLPRTWAAASVSNALTALALGTYKGVSGNVARPIFNTIGPLLSLSAALLITRYSAPDDTRRGQARDTQR